MTVAFDAFSQSAINAVGGADMSWTHTPVGTPRGVIVTVRGSTGNQTATYGGVAMAEVTGSPLTKSTGEPATGLRIFFLGASIPSGAQTVVVLNDDVVLQCSATTLTAANDTEVVDTSSISTDSVANPSGTLSLLGRTSFCLFVGRSGHQTIAGTSPNANWTQRDEFDIGSQIALLHSFDTIGSADVTFGWAQTAEDATALGIAVSEVAGGQTIPVGQVTETDLAQAVGVAKSKTIGLAAETDSAFGVSSVTAIPVGLATENDSAFAVATAKSKAVGLVLEADSAFEVTANRAHAVGLATESDSALAVTRTSGIPVGQAVENDSVFAVSAAKSRSAGLATESDSAFAVTADRAHQVGLAVENDSAFDIGHFRVKEIGLATETDQAFAVIGGAVPIRKRAKYMLLNIGRMLH